MGQILVKSEYNPRQYESRSLLNEAVQNRAEGIMKEWEVSSIYNGPDRAAVEVMHKHQATYNEIAWVLAGDNITKSNEVYAYIDSVLKATNQDLGNMAYTMTGQANEAGNPTRSHMQDNASLGLPGYSPGMGGQAKGPQSASVQDTHPTQQEQQQQGGFDAHSGQVAKPGLWNRMKTWAKDRAAPAAARGLRHLGAGIAGGMAAGPAGLLAGTGASMYQAHQAKKRGDYGKVMGGEGGLNQIAADAGKQAGQNIQDFGAQQAQNWQTGQGVAGKVGQAAGAAGNLAGAAGRGIASAAGAVAKPFQDAWQQAGQQQQANAAAMPQYPAMAAAGMPGSTPLTAENSMTNVMPGNRPGEQAQVDPAAAQEVTQQGQQPQQQQGQQPWGTAAQPTQGAVGSQTDMAQQRLMQMSSDNPSAYSTIESILKGQ